jgi:exodeoxyribonuclease-1
MNPTILWYDYETTGADTVRDRPLQFAAIRTDLELNRIAEPVELFARPPLDRLPHPEAVLTTGITPQQAWERGLCEADFIRQVVAELGAPGTISCGYNTIRFDDEMTRHTLYRSLRDPYAREWQSGNGRWDLIDLVRATHDLRPDGLVWPTYDDGRPCFKLDRLTLANGIEHSEAHDAVADVEATIALARLIRERQPRLWSYAWSIRHKRALTDRLSLETLQPLVHTSGMLCRKSGCSSLVAPIAFDRENRNACHLWDLRFDPAPLLELPVDQLREVLFTPRDKRPADAPAIALKQLHINRAPFVAPAATLDQPSAERLQIDTEACARHLGWLQHNLAAVRRVVDGIYAAGPALHDEVDPDMALYRGGFFSDSDRRLMEEIHLMSPERLAGHQPPFADPRLAPLLFRYRARNWPETLGEEEAIRWEEQRMATLEEPERRGGGTLSLAAYGQMINRMRSVAPPDDNGLHQILDQLESWGEWLMGG